eukprot:765895-Hanusia_phi.AAC.2
MGDEGQARCYAALVVLLELRHAHGDGHLDKPCCTDHIVRTLLFHGSDVPHPHNSPVEDFIDERQAFLIHARCFPPSKQRMQMAEGVSVPAGALRHVNCQFDRTSSGRKRRRGGPAGKFSTNEDYQSELPDSEEYYHLSLVRRAAVPLRPPSGRPSLGRDHY